jgi:voltage-gated potassium channel
VVAHEVFAQLSTPLLWRFLQEVPRRSDRWAADLIDRMTEDCGRQLHPLWNTRLTPAETPALNCWLSSGEARLGDLLRDPDDRDERLPVVVLMVLRDGETVLTPDDDFVLAPEDELLLTGRPVARRKLDMTMIVDGAREYVVTGRHVPASWIWRKLSTRAPT